jgi:osmoprotectant transport system ATP-binding protein
MIRLEQLEKRYATVTAVRGVNLEIPEGQMCMLIGPSGCGKTTTLKMINRLIEPSAGRVLIDQRDVSSLPGFELRRGIGYAIQSVGLLPHLTVAQNVGVVPGLLGWEASRIRTRVSELLELVGLSQYANAYPKALSGGQAQRIGVARALAADPPILLMDEPFGAVDPLTRERLQNEFLNLQRTLKKTVVMVTHDIDEAIKLGDRIVLMNNGLIEQDGTPEEMLESPATDFVRDFIGSDSGLKRLVRINARAALKPTPTVAFEAGRAAATPTLEKHKHAYVVDSSGVLRGWASRNANEFTLRLWSEMSLTDEANLREVLSKMIGLGFRELPITDAAGRLLGVIKLEDAVQGGVEGQTAKVTT